MLTDRPALGPVLAGLGAGDVLVVAKLERLSRSAFDFTRLMRAANEDGWALVCLDPEFDLTTAAGRMVSHVFAAFAEFERDQLIERLQGAKRAKAKRGGYVGGARRHRRYGYRLDELPDASAPTSRSRRSRRSSPRSASCAPGGTPCARSAASSRPGASPVPPVAAGRSPPSTGS